MSLRLFITFSVLLTIFTCCKKSSQTVNVVMYTSAGNIYLELYQEQAPVTVANFLRYTDSTYYDNAEFYRVVKPGNQPDNNIKIEVIQGGPGERDFIEFPPITHENTIQTGIKHLDGTISMARADTGTVTSDFFICIGKQPALDYGGKRNPDGQGFAAFGRVTHGSEVVKHIQKLPQDRQLLRQAVRIDSIRRVN
jgi:peptidyl-prolyl cis-trans isomerase A (cyclophilin A)